MAFSFAHLGRFLPRLGPFHGTAHFYLCGPSVRLMPFQGGERMSVHSAAARRSRRRGNSRVSRLTRSVRFWRKAPYPPAGSSRVSSR